MPVVINGTTGITNVNGSAAAPAETGTDTDTGIYYGTNTVGLATNGTSALFVDASQNVSLTAGLAVAGNNISAVNSMGFRNRIINGAMVIDQRNAGAAVTQSTATVYTVDRWAVLGTVTSKFTAQQNAGAVTPPAGFTNYLGITSTSAYSVTGNDNFQVYQVIEGFNIADFAWGTANAQPATLSFWVRSSLTGTFGGSIATTKTTVWVMPFTYTISSANTWTYITVAIPAATSTSGTNTDNSAGIFVRFGLGATGTGAGGTAGTWTSAGNYIQPSGTVSVVGTNGATFYITGVQLEAGSVATPFERRSYNIEFDMCRRYFERHNASTNYCNASGLSASTTQTFMSTTYYPKRASPTCTASGTVTDFKLQSSGGTYSSSAVPFLSVGSTTSCFLVGNTTGMTAASGSVMFLTGTATLDYSAEL